MEDNPGGRQERFMELYGPLHNRLARYVQTIVWNHEDAKDIISETVLRAYESMDRIKNPESFLYYLFTIARRQTFKMEKRKRWWGLYDHTKEDNLADAASNPVSRLEMKEFRAALNRLPEKQRETVILFEISGLSLEEIKKVQGGSISGVKSRLVRGRSELGRLLEYEKSNAVNDNSVSDDQSRLHLNKAG
jgi:RNA polymerase sigma-70 factor, ECF subfamily